MSPSAPWVPATTPWLRSSAGVADHARQVTLDFVPAHESAAAAPRNAPDQAAVFQHRQRLAQGRPADPQLGRERALRTEPLPGAQPPGRDPLGEHPAHVLRAAARGMRLARDIGHQPGSTASGDSGSTCPPSTTIVCPVMNPASSLARNSAAWPISSTVPSLRSGMAAVICRM